MSTLPSIVAPGPASTGTGRARALPAPGLAGGFGAFRLFGGHVPPTLSLMQQVAVATVERIVDGRYAPGSFLSEKALADEFHASKAPVSEAFFLVEPTGLLEIVSRKGARVAAMSVADFDDLMMYVDLFVPIAIQSFVERRTAQDWAALAGYIAAMEEMVSDDARTFQFLELENRAFLHMVLRSGYPRLARTISPHALQILRYSRLGFRSSRARRSLLAKWRQGLRSLKSGDLSATVRARDEMRALRHAEVIGALARDAGGAASE